MDLRFMRLWDLYSPLLTTTQREITDLYFNFNLSLSEIAEEKGCSRQSVSECLNTCRKKLEDFEGKLHFLGLLTESSLHLSLLTERVKSWAEGLEAEKRAELQEILNRDDTEEVAKALKAQG